MAAGEGNPGTLNYLAPLASFWVEKNFFFMPDENNDDLSDVYSDSGSERDENSQNVVRWLESLPAHHQWYEAEEEQIGRVESFEGAMYNGISTIGDTDAPITLKSLRSIEHRPENIETKKISKNRKYRKGTLHANSTTIEHPENKKKSVSRERRATSSKKSSVSSTKVPEVSNSRESREMKNSTCCRPIFCKPEVEQFLDTAMSASIKKYKRNERTWESIGNNVKESNEPPAKKSKPVETIERKRTK